MTALGLLRFFVVEIVVLGLLFLGFAELMNEVRRNGFHWFKTPFTACWLMIGYLSVFYLVLFKMRDLEEGR